MNIVSVLNFPIAFWESKFSCDCQLLVNSLCPQKGLFVVVLVN